MSFESFDLGTPEEPDSERLRTARSLIARLFEVEPDSVDSLRLAEILPGVSEAVTDIALAGQASEMARLPEKVRSYPAFKYVTSLGIIVMRHLAPTTPLTPATPRAERLLMVRLEPPVGAAMAVRSFTPLKQRILYGVQLPTIPMLQEILKTEPVFWQNASVYAQETRRGMPMMAYPFHGNLYKTGDPAHYLRILQKLSADLLMDYE
jgi:hypothetical protein